MGYLNNASVTVDAILTTKGRELLSQGGSTKGLDIRYFALGDDEVNYDLWNPANPLGSDYYGIIIENMPVLEASPIPEQNLRSKLITLPKGSTTIATVQSQPPAIGTGTTNALSGLKYSVNGSPTGILDATLVFSLSQTGFDNNTLGYTVNFDSKYFTVIADSIPVGFKSNPNITTSSAIGFNLGDAGTLSSVITANSIKLSLKNPAPSEFLNTIAPGAAGIQYIYVTGNEIGGRLTIPVYIGRASF